MRSIAFLLVLVLVMSVSGADVESRVLTHYLPQDFLETVVRSEKWTALSPPVKGGLRKGDVVRIWSGGLIDRGNGEKPGQNVNGPEGTATDETSQLTLSPDGQLAFALLFKAETSGIHKCLPTGKPLEITLNRDNEAIWVGFNDERGRYLDNHLGKGLRHERDPLWVRIEVVRIIVD
jgi:hypothetical protein